MKTEKPLECPIIAGFPANSINERGFGTIPTRVMDDMRLSMGARCLYALLAAHAGSQHEAWPSVKRIIATLGCTEKTFYKYRAELSDAGYISIETRQTRYGRRTVYVIEQIVEYSSASELESEEKFSTNPSSEPYSKNYRMASEAPSNDVEKWKTDGEEGTHTVKITGSHTVKITGQNINKGIETKYSTTTPTESDSQLGQCGTAHAAPVVSSPTAPSSGLNLGSKKKNEEAPLVRDSIDEAFYVLEARSLRRTESPAVKEAARLTYRRLVIEGHSIEDISAAYDNYLAWVKSDNVKNPRGMWKWLEKDFKRNNDEAKEKRAAAQKMDTKPQATSPSGEGGIDAAEYRRRSQEVSTIGFDGEAEYRVQFAEESNDEHLRHLAATIRAEKPVTLSNGLVDDRLSKRPSYDVLWSHTNKKEHHRDYVLWAYERLKAERKVH